MTTKKSFNIDLVLIIFAVLIIFKLPIDPDFGWHYKYGEYILATKSVPRENLFSFTMSNYEWANSYWLSQIIIYLAFHNFGSILASMLFSLVVFLPIYFIFIKHKPLAQKLVVTLVFSMYSAFFTISMRPMLFSTIFLVLLCHVLLNKKGYKKFLPILFLFWANMHADFVIGLFILGVFTLFAIFSAEKTFGPVFKHALVWVLCFLVTFINPYFAQLHVTLFKELNNTSLMSVSEMLPLARATVLSFFILQHHFFLGTIMAINIVTRKKLTVAHFCLLVIFFLLALRAVYFYRIFLVLSLFALSKFLTTDFDISWLLETPFIRHAHKALKHMLAFFLILAVCILGEKVYLAFNQTSVLAKSGYPVEIVEYVKNNPPEGNMFNNYNFGGYLIWHLPQYKTFVDGRMPAWNTTDDYSVYEDYIKMMTQPEQHAELIDDYIDKYNITFAIDSTNSKLTKFLADKRGWEIVVASGTTVMAVK